jgi:arginyl-tRNA synthetase
MDPVAELHAAVEAAAGAVADGGLKARPTLERPKQAGHGDYSTNVAMLLAPVAGAPPRDVAERVGERLKADLGDRLAAVEVAGPGFLNLRLADAWYGDALRYVLDAGESFGSVAPTGNTALVEFVSANPTGPLTAASGRHGAYGDACARLLEAAGYAVTREYYANDAGTQVVNLGLSIQARARGGEPPEDGYQGDYVRELAAAIPNAAEAPPEELAEQGVAIMTERIRATLHAYRIDFDEWFSEKTLHPDGIATALERVAEHTYSHDGALWLRTTTWGDDKDRVLVRSTGEPTYLASDLAHHAVAKVDPGYDLLVNVLGSDHHGYIARIKAAVAALGGDPEHYDVRILQFVHLIEGGSRAGMSKRRGEFVTLDELLSEIGVDATRWYMLSRSHDSTIDLDLDLARRDSAENPVYYVQYAHARIVSVLAKAGEQRVAAALAEAGPAGASLEPAERALVMKLLAFPGEVAESAARRAPHRIANYALELAQDFSAFYRDCHVVGAEPAALESFRLGLSVASRRTIARALDLLGVSAPESM